MQEIGMDENAGMGYNQNNEDSISLKTGIMQPYQSKRKELTAMAAIDMNRKAFEETLKANELVLMDFWAPWCPDCVRITEAYDQIAREFEGRMVVGKVNIDDENAVLTKHSPPRLLMELLLLYIING